MGVLWLPLALLSYSTASLFCLETSNLIVSRQYSGDLFTYKHAPDVCNGTFCYEWGGLGASPVPDQPCRCRCQSSHPTYREDVGVCINDVPECHLADFSIGDTQEKLPFVFMPNKGELVHPSAEITMKGVAPDEAPVIAPVCVVSGAEVMTPSGWILINSSFEPPFRLHRDRGKTFIRWVGEEVSEDTLKGRVVLVRLLCKDAGNENRPKFRPCVAFRVAGTIGADAAETTGGGGSSSSLAIGLSIGLVLLVYLVAMGWYLVRWRRRRHRVGDQLIEDALMGQKPTSKRQRRRQDSAQGQGSGSNQSSPRSGSRRSTGSHDVSERLPKNSISTLVATHREDDEDDEVSELNTSLRRRLYFNPIFFDPEMLQDPPLAAQEFLVKIREMITIAKMKMQTKQFNPTLEAITEYEDEAEEELERTRVVDEGPRQSAAVDIDRWLEHVVRESASEASGSLYGGPVPPGGRSRSPLSQTTWSQQASRQRRNNITIGYGNRRNMLDDPLNDLVSEAESKVPKLHSDEDSMYSDPRTVDQRARLSSCVNHLDRLVDPPYEDINISDRSLSTFSSEQTSVSINGEGTVIHARGKMTIELESGQPPTSDLECEEDVLDPDTLDKRRIKVRKSRKVQRKASFYDDSLERRKRGINFEEKFETTHINVNTMPDGSIENEGSIYKQWGSLHSNSDNNSLYPRINFVSSRSQTPNQLVVANLRRSQRKLKTFKDYNTVKFDGKTSLIEQWKKKNQWSLASSQSSPQRSLVTSPAPSTVQTEPETTLVRSRITSPEPNRETLPPVPPKAAISTLPTDAPPLPPRNHSPQREVQPSSQRLESLSAHTPVARSPLQPPLPPKSVQSSSNPPPPLPSKSRPLPAVAPHRYFLGEMDAMSPADFNGRRHRRNSAGESETNSTASSHAESGGSVVSSSGEAGRHIQRSMSTSDVSRPSIGSSAGCRSPNVLQRIAECERTIDPGPDAGKGMKIALSLRQRQESTSGSSSERSGFRTKRNRPSTESAPVRCESTSSEETNQQPLSSSADIRTLMKKFERPETELPSSTGTPRTRRTVSSQ